MDIAFKLCSKCKEEKPVDKFSFIKNRNRYHSWCKNCSSKGRMKIYYENPKAHREYQKEYIERLKVKKDSLKTHCIKCGESDICCLDFHHKDPKEKKFNIGASYRKKGIPSLENEINKCIVLCTNCHRKFHAGRFTL